MRELTFKILTVLLCITLMVNFARVFFLPTASVDERTEVDLFTIFDAISEFEVDPRPLYDSFGDCLGTLVAVTYSGSVFTQGWKKGANVLESIANILIAGYNVFNNVGLIIAQSLIAFWQGVVFLFNLWNAILELMNTLLGSVFHYAKVITPNWVGGNGDAYHGGGDGFAGGGFGGRR